MSEPTLLERLMDALHFVPEREHGAAIVDWVAWKESGATE